MKPKSATSIRLAVLLGLLGATAALAFESGGFAFTKMVETPLHAGPSADSPPAGKLGFKRKVKVDEVRGRWMNVSDGDVHGWVFSGSLALIQPAESKGTDGTPLSASQTTASAGIRPLTPEAEAYATRRNLGETRNDLNWLQPQCKAITDAEVDAYMRAHKRGEFQ